MRHIPQARRLVAAAALAAAALALPGCASSERPGTTADAVPRYSIEDFLRTTSFRGASFSHDGRTILVSSDQTGVYNAFAIPTGGGEPVQLTRSTGDSVLIESCFPADGRFLYRSDQGGDELDHLYVRETDGAVTDLTPGQNLKARFGGWAQDDRSFFMTTNERNPKYFDVYEVATDGYERTLLYRNDTGYELADVSPDKRYLVFEKTQTTTDSDIYLYDTRTSAMKHLTPHQGEMVNDPQTFSRDGRFLYYLTDEGSEFRYLARLELAGSGRTVIQKPDWDVLFARLSRKGRYLVVGINNDARTEVRVFETATMRPIPLPSLPVAEIASAIVSPDETRLAFFANGSRSPNDLFLYELGSGESRRLTRSLNPAIESDHLVDAQVVRFRSFDDVEVPGLLYRPHQADGEAKAPALVWVHGGPGGQSRVGYSGLLQYLVNHGYAVFAINNRGSSGYGKTFFTMDDRKHGEADLGDCVASRGFLAATGFIDPDRIGIIGGSYGGYMVLAALAYRPDAFTAGVDLFGVANWVRTLKSIPPYWESFREALYKELGDPGVDEAYLRRISPLFHAGNITRPLLVLQGANDARVLKVESDEMVEAARANGAPVEYVVFDDEGHGFEKKANRLRGYRTILEFLDRHLRDAGMGAAPAAG
jgi:dipeptidyl aminopeptidase/acylaminoacyl peptidase